MSPNDCSNVWQINRHQHTDGEDAAVENHNVFQPETNNNSHTVSSSLYNAMKSLTQHNNVWHPESLYGVSWLQPTSEVNRGNNGSRLRWSMPTWWTTPQSSNLVSSSHDNSGLSPESWTVFLPAKGTAWPVERLGTLQTLTCAVSLRWDSNNVQHCRILPSYQAERGLSQLHSSWLTNYRS